MSLNTIDRIELLFKWLDRVNIMVYNVWRDKQADAYKTGLMHLLDTLYRTYVSDMRQISNELMLLQKQIEEEKQEIFRLQNEISKMKREPSIEGCYSVFVEGYNSDETLITTRIAAAPEEQGDLEGLALWRVTDIVEIEEVHLADKL